jgi:hypothetical protein
MTSEEYAQKLQNAEMNFADRMTDLNKGYSDERSILFREWNMTKCIKCNHLRSFHFKADGCHCCDCKEFVEVTKKELA